MSIKVTSLVWERSKAKGTDLLGMLAMADHAHDDGAGIRIARETLQLKTRVDSNRTADAVVARLLASGELVQTYTGGKWPGDVNEYRIDLAKLNAQPIVGRRVRMAERAAMGANIAPIMGADSAPVWGQLPPEGGQPAAPKPSVEPKKKKAAPSDRYHLGSLEEEPAVKIHRRVFGRAMITREQAVAIIETVTDFSAWEALLTDWLLQKGKAGLGWRPSNVEGQLERYSIDRKRAEAVAARARQVLTPAPEAIIADLKMEDYDG